MSMRALAAFSLALLTACHAEAPSRAFEAQDLASALALAGTVNKLVVVDFFTTWCGPCKKLDRDTWGNADVQKWFEGRAFLVKLDAEKERATAERFRVEAYPTIVFLASDGTEKDRLVGYRDAQTFLDEVAQIAVGKTSMERAEEEFAGNENDPMQRGKFADELARQGKYAEALEHYLWCFDHGANAVGYGGVRLSFLLSDIAQLAKKYPPARQALEDRRAAALRKLEDEDAGTTGALRAATELHALDRELEQPERTLADFDRLRSAGKLSADEEKCLRFQLVHQLTEKRRYGEVLQSCGGDAQKRVDAELKQSQAMKAFAKQHNPDLAAMEDDTDHEFVVERCTDFYEAELGAGSPDKAREIAMKLTLFHPKGSTYAALIDCSVHAERFDAARKLADDAKAALDAEELAAVNSAAAKIPPK